MIGLFRCYAHDSRKSCFIWGQKCSTQFDIQSEIIDSNLWKGIVNHLKFDRKCYIFSWTIRPRPYTSIYYTRIIYHYQLGYLSIQLLIIIIQYLLFILHRILPTGNVVQDIHSHTRTSHVYTFTQCSIVFGIAWTYPRTYSMTIHHTIVFNVFLTEWTVQFPPSMFVVPFPHIYITTFLFTTWVCTVVQLYTVQVQVYTSNCIEPESIYYHHDFHSIQLDAITFLFCRMWIFTLIGNAQFQCIYLYIRIR